MTTLKALSDYLAELLQIALVPDYGPNGLQIEGRQKIKRIATGISADLKTIEAAVSYKADALIVHHGLFWSGDNPVITGSKREKIRLLLQNDISLLSYHLPLDIHREYGNNWKAAQELGWKDLKPFGMMKGIAIGVKGSVSNLSREKFQQQLEKYYKHPATCALGGKRKINTAALISGGAYKSIIEAAAEGIDCFVTGNFDEPVWHQAFEEKINFFALGHAATERIGPRALGEHLKQHFGVEHQFVDTQNPF